MKRYFIVVLSLLLVILTACTNGNIDDFENSVSTVSESENSHTIVQEDTVTDDNTKDSSIVEESSYWSFEDEDYAVKIDISGVISNNWHVTEGADTSNDIYSYRIFNNQGSDEVDSFDFNADCKIYIADVFDGFSAEFKEIQDTDWQYSDAKDISFGVQHNRPYIWWREWCDNQGTPNLSDYVYDVHYRVALNSNLGNENVKFLCIDLHMPIDGIYDSVKDYDVLTEIGNTILRDSEFDKRNEFIGVSDLDNDYAKDSQMILFDESSSSDVYLVFNNFIKGSYINDFHKVEMPKDQYASWNTICFTTKPFEGFDYLDLESLPFQTLTVDSISYNCYKNGENLVFISEPFEDCYLVVRMECLRIANMIDYSFLIDVAKEEILSSFKVYNGSTLVVGN